MIDQQPNTEEIYKVLAEAKQYHRDMLVKLIHANAPTESLLGVMEVLYILDSVGTVAAARRSPNNARHGLKATRRRPVYEACEDEDVLDTEDY